MLEIRIKFAEFNSTYGENIGGGKCFQVAVDLIAIP